MNRSDYEKPGQFYLGKEYDLETDRVAEDLVLYDSKDLVTHGVVLGMTGSGKTGLCITLLEEAAMDNVPAIVIDPKGDISNLMLTFPELDGRSFRPWINEDDAAKKGKSSDDHAEDTAAMWAKGLQDWGQGTDRIQELRGKVDVNIFTPGSTAGIPVSILSSLRVPEAEVMEDSELYGERIKSTVESLLSLVGIEADGTQSVEGVLLGAIFQKEWGDGRAIELGGLIRLIQRPSFGKVGVIDLESFYPEKARQSLALKFNSLLASPGFSTWLEGAPLEIDQMLHDDEGRAQISIYSIAHLNNRERMFFVSLLLNQLLGWMRTQRGTTSLRALMYMDEIFGFLPPTANPPSKRPLMTLLKQGRAFGLGCLLATQNPVDLDYKALSNIGTWFLGRLQTERDKMRVLDGLEGASGTQNAKFDRKKIDTLLSGLGNRVFLMNNVHEDGPVLFHVRWVMSYLAGPLSRGQIKGLMVGKREKYETLENHPNPMARKSDDGYRSDADGDSGGSRPVVGRGVLELFNRSAGRIYDPYLLREGTIHFFHNRGKVEGSRKVVKVNRILEKEIDYENSEEIDLEEIGEKAASEVGFSDLPGYAMNAANYRQVEKNFSEKLYRGERETIFECEKLDLWSEIGESEGAFRVRIRQDAREARDRVLEDLQASLSGKVHSLEGRIRTAEGRLAKEELQASSAKMQAGIAVMGGILKSMFGRKAGIGGMLGGTRGGSIRKATAAYEQHQDIANAEAKVEHLVQELTAMKEASQVEQKRISEEYDVENLALTRVVLKPTRANVNVERVCLLWK